LNLRFSQVMLASCFQILIVTWFPALAPPGNNTHGMGERAWSSAWLSFEGNFKIAVVYFQLFDVYQFWVSLPPALLDWWLAKRRRC
jgi:hypothetical protein